MTSLQRYRQSVDVFRTHLDADRRVEEKLERKCTPQTVYNLTLCPHLT